METDPLFIVGEILFSVPSAGSLLGRVFAICDCGCRGARMEWGDGSRESLRPQEVKRPTKKELISLFTNNKASKQEVKFWEQATGKIISDQLIGF